MPRLLTVEEKIKSVLKEIQPDGFNWTDITPTEMLKFKAVANFTRQETAREIFREIEKVDLKDPYWMGTKFDEWFESLKPRYLTEGK